MNKTEYFQKLDALKQAARAGELQEVVAIAKQLGDFFYQLSEDAEDLLWARKLANWYATRYPGTRDRS